MRSTVRRLLDGLLEKPAGPGNINFLFICHFLSTWNARCYEFATMLFIAKAFPEALSFVSWSGITTSLSIILFASSLGRWIDNARSRLKVLVTSICINRSVIIVSCIGWATLLDQGLPENHGNEDQSVPVTDDKSDRFRIVKMHIFQTIILLGVIERLSRVATLLSVERDWVPKLAFLEMDNKFLQTPQDLAHLNAVMSRIDLICKLLSPIVVAFLMSSTNSPQFTLWSLVGMNVIAWPFECWTAWKVWLSNPSLQESQHTPSATEVTTQEDLDTHIRTSRCFEWARHIVVAAIEWVIAYVSSLEQYFSSDVWMPSIAVTSLHFSVLSFSSILTVFLLQSGFSAGLITWGEVFSAVFELSSTFIFAWGVRFLSIKEYEYVALQDAGQDSSANEDSGVDNLPLAASQSIGSSRLGMWAVLQMFIVLIPTLPALWQFSDFGSQKTSEDSGEPSFAWKNHLLPTLLIIFFISASRLGRWTAVLSVQQLAQTCVKPSQRSVFAGIETSFASLFGLGHFVVTMIWNTHEEFKWVVTLLSLGVVAGSTTMYWIWLFRMSPAAHRR